MNLTQQERMVLKFQYPLSDQDVIFFDGLRDGELRGFECDQCGLCYAPPRPNCTRCLRELSKWHPLEPTGTIRAMTVVMEAFPELPKPPYTLAYVQPEGADTCILNYVKGVRLGEDGAPSPGVGERVRIRFKTRRSGRITDFYFSR